MIDNRALAGKAWGWFVALGIALIALGLLASADLFAATVATAYYVGILMFAGGVLQLTHAFASRGWGNVLFWLLSGLLYLLAGVSVFLDPLFAASFFTLMLAVFLGLSGLFRLWVGFGARLSGRGWIIASGLASIAAAVVIAIGWPVNGLWVLGLILAIDLTFQGAALLFTGLTLRLATRGL